MFARSFCEGKSTEEQTMILTFAESPSPLEYLEGNSFGNRD
jgi:hypothetical protein